jgi:hypothetical protein
MYAKMPIVIESVGDQGQRVEQGFEWPDDSALKRVEKEGGAAGENIERALRVQIKGSSYDVGPVLICPLVSQFDYAAGLP